MPGAPRRPCSNKSSYINSASLPAALPLLRGFGDALVPPVPFVLALLAFGVNQLLFPVPLGAGAAEHDASVLQGAAKSLAQSIDAAVYDIHAAELTAAGAFLLQLRLLNVSVPNQKNTSRRAY